MTRHRWDHPSLQSSSSSSRTLPVGWGSEGWWGGEGWPVTTFGLEGPLDLGGTTGLPSPDGGIGSARLSSSLLECSSPRSCVSAHLREAPTALVPDYLFKGV